MQREIRSPITPREQTEADAAFRHANTRGITINPSKTVKVRIVCNQLTPNAGMCDYSKWLEERAADAQRIAEQTLFLHFRSSHPYMTQKDALALSQRATVNLRDITASPRGVKF